MAVQKSRKSRSCRGMRRAHNALAAPAVSVEQTTGEIHQRHHVSAKGFYKGKQVVVKAEKRSEKKDN